MALIACPDCGRQVSSLARECPGCARPIAGDAALRVEERRPAPDPKPPADVQDGEKLDPADLARLQRDRVVARVEGVDKRCVRCGRDVTDDFFRAKDGRGYTCAECQDLAIDETVAARARWVRALWAVIVVLLVGVAVVGALSTTSVLSNKNTPRK